MSATSVLKVQSPDKQVSFELFIEHGKPLYAVSYKESILYEKAALGHKINGVDLSENVVFCDAVTEDKTVSVPLLGRMKTVSAAYTAATIALKSANVPFVLEVRVYNEGVAFRLVYDALAGKTVNAEYTAFKVSPDAFAYASFGCRGAGCQRFARFAGYNAICYEASYDRFPVREIFQPTEKQNLFHQLRDGAADAENFILTPMAVEFPERDGKVLYGAILEAHVRHYVGVNLRQKGEGLFQLNTTYQPGKQFVDFDVTGDNVVTPYRVLAIAEDLNALYNNPILSTVNPPAEGDFSWVVPGRSAWSWRSNGSFTGKIDTMYNYTDAAIKLGFEYNILDGRWSLFADDIPTLFNLVKTLVDDSAPFSVNQVVWSGFTANEARFPLGKKAEELTNGVRIYYPDYDYIEKLFAKIAGLGIKGFKIDFMPPEDQPEAGVDIYEWVAKLAEKYHLAINFHGAMKPSGLNITYPNVLNYEGIFGHEMGPVRQPENETHLFTTQYLTRGLAGHADFTPHVQNAYGLAELVFVDAPFNAIDATPTELTENRGIEFIKACPTVWDETRVLSPSKFGEFAAIAKCKDGNWFLGVINHDRDAAVPVALSEFLEEGTYILELYTDRTVSKKLVTKEDVLSVALPHHSGSAARISKVAMSPYGGMITTPVVLTFAQEGMTARYTLDGTDPVTSETAIAYTGAVTLEATCRMQVAVFDENGNLTNRLSYLFNLLDEGNAWTKAATDIQGKVFDVDSANVKWLSFD